MNVKNKKTTKSETVSDKDAEAGAPEDYSIAGEEDPGVALEQWVNEQHKASDKADKAKSDKSSE